MDGGVVGLSKSALTQFVNMVLAEDLGTNGDITSQATIEEDARLNALPALPCRCSRQNDRRSMPFNT